MSRSFHSMDFLFDFVGCYVDDEDCFEENEWMLKLQPLLCQKSGCINDDICHCLEWYVLEECGHGLGSLKTAVMWMISEDI